MFSISELARASSSGMVLMSIAWSGIRPPACFSSASAARAPMHALRIARLSRSARGGSFGSALYGLAGSKPLNGPSSLISAIDTSAAGVDAIDTSGKRVEIIPFFRQIDQLDRGQQLRNPRLEREQRALAREAAGVAGEAAARADDAVAGHEDRERVAPGRRARGARAAGRARAARELVVRDRLAERDGGDRVPHGFLERRALGRERRAEDFALSREVLGELALRLREHGVPRVAAPAGLELGVVFLAVEVDA